MFFRIPVFLGFRREGSGHLCKQVSFAFLPAAGFISFSSWLLCPYPVKSSVEYKKGWRKILSRPTDLVRKCFTSPLDNATCGQYISPCYVEALSCIPAFRFYPQLMSLLGTLPPAITIIGVAFAFFSLLTGRELALIHLAMAEGPFSPGISPFKSTYTFLVR